MRKSIVTLFLLCVMVSAWAVDLPKQGLGLHIGYAQPTLRVNDPSHKDTLNNNMKLHGFKVGLVYDASYIAGFGSSIGINYTFGAYNGGWEKVTIYNYPQSRQLITYNELEMFVDWQYKFEIAKETYLMLYTGPTIQCGLAFGMRQDIKDEDLAGEISVKYGERYDCYKVDKTDETTGVAGYTKADNALQRINITWGVGAGFQYKRYFLRGGYDFGLMVPFRNADFTNGVHTRGRMDQWGIRIGMYLWYEE